MRSGLAHLYRRYDLSQPPSVILDLKEAMAGTKNLCAQAQQYGEGNIEGEFSSSGKEYRAGVHKTHEMDR